MSRKTAVVGWSFGALGVGVLVALAGPLDPPGGAVAPTYKTLTEVEPRVAVNGTNTPGDADSVFRISQPGSYYLVGNMIVPSGRIGVEIGASNVTLDLMGFTIQGLPGSLAGVRRFSGQERITVRNGTITSMGQQGIDLGLGVSLDSGSLVERVSVASCGAEGIQVGNISVVRECTAQGCTVGIQVGTASVVQACTARLNSIIGIDAFSGGSITGCTAYQNTQAGIQSEGGGVITACSAHANGLGIVGILGTTITGCTVTQNTGDGIQLGRECLVLGNTCDRNGGAGSGAGIHAVIIDNRIEGNTCTLCSRGIEVTGAGNIIVRNTCTGNTTDWVIAANNVYGPILDRRAPASAAVSGFSGPGSMGSTDPNANYSY